MKRSDLKALKSKFTYKELSSLTSIPERTLQRWISQGIPQKKKTPNKGKIERLEVARELTKGKRNKRKIAETIEKIPENVSLSESKNKLKKYLNIKIDLKTGLQQFKRKNFLINFRKTVISEWKNFKEKYRFAYLMSDIIQIFDVEENRTVNRFVGRVVSKVFSIDDIEKILSDFISNAQNFLGQYDTNYKLQNFTLKFLNIKQ